jgi:catechol 2,3-dioxygenase-like lactoylglutathione lyase family enzyme
MAVRRIKPNIRSNDFEASRRFYNNVIGPEGGDGLDWILFFGTDRREVQLSVMTLDIKAHVHPDVTIEVGDVDAVHARATAAGAEIVYPLTDEEWGATPLLCPRPKRRRPQRDPASRRVRSLLTAAASAIGLGAG